MFQTAEAAATNWKVYDDWSVWNIYRVRHTYDRIDRNTESAV